MKHFFFAVASFVFAITANGADEKPLSGAIIVVDPGHGGQAYSKSYTGGTRGVDSKLTESELNLRVSKELVPLLRDAGATVFTTREADHRLSREGTINKQELHARIDFFEHHNCHFYLSLHHNAGAEALTGHMAIYKHNAKDDTLYQACAKSINEALKGAVPGPKRELIKGDYHLTRETDIPGTIIEAGFQSNKEFDRISNLAEFPRIEAKAILKGTIAYWTQHKTALETFRAKLMAERAANPRNPDTYTATALNPAFQNEIAMKLKAIEPSGEYTPKDAAKYLAAFRRLYPAAEQAKFDFQVTVDEDTIRLTGSTKDRKYHDDFIDVLVAMKLYTIKNEITLPKK